jgi:hypothetical protein
MQFGYDDSPFEKMAYALQTAFERRILTTNTVELINRDTDAIWNGVSSLFSKV